jgi:cupredoxin-like protein
VRLGSKAMVAGGLLVAAAGALLMSRVGADTGFALIAAAEAVLGLGLGLAVVTAGDAVLGALPANETGGGMALVRTAQFVAMSLGVAILGSILNGAYRAGLAGHLAGLPAGAWTAANGSVAGARALAPHVFAAARDAYATGMSDVLIVSAVVVAVAAVLTALFLPARSRVPQSTELAASQDIQEATILVKGGYTPATIVVEHGRPVRLRFRREETSPCSSFVVFGDFDISARLPAGKTVTVDLPPAAVGEYPFTCHLGVLRGTLVAR